MHISIIIATYNAASTLAQCLCSIQEQNYQEMEILIQDGGSTDATLDIIRRFMDKGLPLRWSSEPDHGIYDALNKAIPQAQGDLIVVLGADDALAPGALAAVSATARNQPADIYPGKTLLIYPDGRQANLKVDPCDCRAFMLSTPFCHNAMFASQAAYRAVGLYTTKYRLVSDAHWIHRAIKKGLRFEPVDAVLSHFYVGGASSDPQTLLEEIYRLLQENFPQLSLEDARYLLYVAKGWTDPDRLEEVLGRYPDDQVLCEAARLAAAYAPFSGQREIERQRGSFGGWPQASEFQVLQMKQAM
jgi:glycosyltransferase involved in cell wall biosynthesis